MTSAYRDIPGFEHLHLEDSFVLGVEDDGRSLCLHMLLVLTPTHPEYLPPSPGERHCYRNGDICFVDVRRLHWDRQPFQATVDPDGSRDFGAIDVFEQRADGFFLAGDWGEVLIGAKAVETRLT